MTSAPQPRCDTWRNTSTLKSAATCALCLGPLTSSRARYCSPAHRQQAFRLRHVQLADIDERKLRAELRRRGALVAHTLYECSVCGERSVGDRRCQECHVLNGPWVSAANATNVNNPSCSPSCSNWRCCRNPLNPQQSPAVHRKVLPLEPPFQRPNRYGCYPSPIHHSLPEGPERRAASRKKTLG